MKIKTRLAVLVLGVCLAVGNAGPAWADAIDGDWCIDDGRLMTITRTHIVTPGGNRIGGLYDRHAYAYTVPADEQGAGSRVYMVLVNPETIHLWRDEAAARAQKPPAEIWHRCSAHVS